MKTTGKQTTQRGRRVPCAPILMATLIGGCSTDASVQTEPPVQNDESASPDASTGGAGGAETEPNGDRGLGPQSPEAGSGSSKAPADNSGGAAAGEPPAQTQTPVDTEADDGGAAPLQADAAAPTAPSAAEPKPDASPSATPDSVTDGGSKPEALAADSAAEVPLTDPEPVASYPAGPYGEDNPMVGSIVENLSWRGLLNRDAAVPSSELPAEAFSLASLRGQGHSHLLITTAAGWCGSCRTAANELGQALEARVKALNGRGGAVVTLLLEGLGSEAPTDSELTAWAAAAELEVSVAGPADERTRAVFPQREWAYILSLETMEVIWSQRIDLYANPTVSEVGVAQMEVLLPSP